MTYSKLQTQWLKHHWAKWQSAYDWSPSEFAKRIKQPPEALAEALELPLEAFGPPPAIAPPPTPAPPPALPDPQSSAVVIEPGVELLPREKPDTPPAQPWDARRGFRIF
jgi:hypothetical protein